MKTLASIDIGTNSTRLLIANKFEDLSVRPLCMEERITRLGQGLGESGRLSAEALQRVAVALEEYMRMVCDLNVQEIYIVATSAAREASNPQDLLSIVQTSTGRACEIIDGNKEAHLTFLGVMSDLADYPEMLICDVGGGSVEFILVQNGRAIMKESVAIGSRRLTERFFLHNPVADSEIQAFEQYATSQIPTIRLNNAQCVLVGGTATTLAMMDASYDVFDETETHRRKITYQSIINMTSNLARLTIQERKQIIGLHPERADVILAGAKIIELILKKFNLPDAIVSVRDLLFGLIA